MRETGGQCYFLPIFDYFSLLFFEKHSNYSSRPFPELPGYKIARYRDPSCKLEFTRGKMLGFSVTLCVYLTY